MRDGERNPHNMDGTILERRQVLYYLGLLVSGIGLMLFLSNFVFIACAADQLVPTETEAGTATEAPIGSICRE